MAKFIYAVSTIFLITVAQYGLSATKYVSDTLYIPLKTKSGASSKVITHLKSGTALSIIENEDGADFVKVKVRDGNKTEGWVKKRYLLDEPIAKSRLARLENKIQRMEKQQGPMKDTVKELKSKLKLALKENKALKSNKTNLSKELEGIKKISSDSINMYDENKSLMTEKDKLANSVKTLKQENTLLQSDQKNEGIKLGLFAVSLGGLAGFLLPYINVRGRRKSGVRLR